MTRSLTGVISPRRFVQAQLPARHVSRDRLTARLRDQNARFVVVVGGPGSGKTTLLAEYIRRAPLPSLWLNLSVQEQDSVAFFELLVAGIRHRFPGVSEQAAEVVRSQGVVGLELAVGLLCDELEAVLESGLILVLDNSQHLLGDPASSLALEALVRLAPPGMLIIHSGRATPALKLSRYRLRGEIVNLADVDLAFSRAEVGRLGLATMDTELPTEVINQVMRWTKGWVAGVVYALAGDATHLAQRLEEPDLLYDFLAEEFFDGLPGDFREDLLACAFLPGLESRSVQLLLGPRAATFLARLKSEPTFASWGDDEDRIEFHPIFQDFLRREAERRWPLQRRQELYLRLASQIASSPEERILFLLSARSWQSAEQDLVASAPHLFRGGRIGTVRALVRSFPKAWRQDSTWLRYLEGEIARRERDLSHSLEILIKAGRLAERPPVDKACLGRIYACLAAVYGALGDEDPQLAYAQSALGALAPDDIDFIAMCHNVCGVFYLKRCQPPQAEDSFQLALELYRRAEDPDGEARVLSNLGLLHASQGHFDRAIPYYRESISRATKSGRLPLALTYNNLALASLYLGRMAEAWAALEQGSSLVERTSAMRDNVFLFRTLGQFHLVQEDFLKARECFESSLDEAIRAGDRHSQSLGTVRLAELALRQADFTRAQEAINRAIELADKDLTDPGMAEAAILQAEIAIGRSDWPVAERLLGHLSTQLQSIPHDYLSFHVSRLSGDLAIRCGRPDEAKGHQQQMLALASQFGYSMPAEAVAEGRPIASQTIPALEIRCLGGFEARVDGEPIPARAWRSAKAKLVTVYLLLHPTGATRDSLLELAFPSEDPDRSTLAGIIGRARQALEPAAERRANSRFILFRDGFYSINKGLQVRFDVADFSRMLVEARDPKLSLLARSTLLKGAVDLYKGPFLAEFDDVAWCQIEREYLRRQLSAAYSLLFNLVAEEDAWPELERLARAQLAIDTVAQGALRAVLVALAMQERRNDALRFGQLATVQFRSGSHGVISGPTEELLDLLEADRLTVKAARTFLTYGD